MNERVRGRLNQHIGAVGNTGKPDFAEGDINVHPFVLSGIGNLFSECLELTIQSCSAPPFLLLGLKLLLVAESMFASTVSSFIELHFRGLAVELNVSCLSLPNHDRGFQMDMNQDDQLVGTGLEKQVLDVAKKHVDMLVAEGRKVAKTILVDLHFAGDTLPIERWPKVHVR